MIVNPPAKFHNEKIPKKYRTVSKTVRTGMVRHLRILLPYRSWLCMIRPVLYWSTCWLVLVCNLQNQHDQVLCRSSLKHAWCFLITSWLSESFERDPSLNALRNAQPNTERKCNDIPFEFLHGRKTEAWNPISVPEPLQLFPGSVQDRLQLMQSATRFLRPLVQDR